MVNGIVASTTYQVRALPVVDRPSAWTSWTPATTPATLLTSPDIAVGAVGEKIQSVSLGPWNEGSLPTNVVLVTLDLGAVGVGQGWARRLHFEARKASSTVPLVVEVQRRRAVLGGAMGAWSTVDTINVDTVGWDVYANSGSLAGTYDDFEYRVIMTDNGDTNSSSTDLIRNIYLTLVRITKE